MLKYLHVFVTRSWCPDRVIAQARKYIGDSLGQRYADAVILDLEATWAESDPRTPLVCLLSMGSDPTNQIELLAKKLQVGMYDWMFYSAFGDYNFYNQLFKQKVGAS